MLNKIKDFCYRILKWKQKCICGGHIICYGDYEKYLIQCDKCFFVYEED